MIDSKTLEGLRQLLQQARNGRPSELPMKELVALAGLEPGARVTVDFDAATELGHPLVVLGPSAPRGEGWYERLSPREREVAALVAEGLSNKEIAHRLCIALPTVKDHVHRILSKTRLANRTAVAVAFRS